MYKFFLTIILVLFFSNSSFSQTQQGKFVLSGGTDVKILFSKLDPQGHDVVDDIVKSNEYRFNAGLGYFIMDHLAINIAASYDYSYSKKQLSLGAYPGSNPVYEQSIEKSFGVMPSATYFFPVDGTLKPKISLGAGYMSLIQRNSQSATPDNVIYKYGGISLSGAAGASYFIEKSFSIDLGFQYSRNQLNDKTGANRLLRQNLYGAIAGISVYF